MLPQEKVICYFIGVHNVYTECSKTSVKASWSHSWVHSLSGISYEHGTDYQWLQSYGCVKLKIIYTYLHCTHELRSYTVQFILQMFAVATCMCFLTHFHVESVLLPRTVQTFTLHLALSKIWRSSSLALALHSHTLSFNPKHRNVWGWGPESSVEYRAMGIWKSALVNMHKKAQTCSKAEFHVNCSWTTTIHRSASADSQINI
jgi:hypothetical protein